MEYLTETGSELWRESRFELITSGFDTMLNYHLSQKHKLIGIDEFNHLINTTLLLT